MAKTLLEAYKGRLAVAEGIYKKETGDANGLSNIKKIAIAQTLKNTNMFLNEAFENSVGTQRSDLGAN